GMLESAVVRRAESGVAVRLVHAEHERVRDAVAVHEALELLVAPDHPVDVVPEVDVGVDDLCSSRQLLLELFVPDYDELLGSFEAFFHVKAVYARLVGCRPPCRTSSPSETRFASPSSGTRCRSSFRTGSSTPSATGSGMRWSALSSYRACASLPRS